jgi:DNA-binding NarL/FixJ family response regulator
MILTINLSPRERQVLDCRAKGFPYKQVASELGITDNTVRSYIKQIHTKLNANNLIGAVRNLQLMERGEKVSKKI